MFMTYIYQKYNIYITYIYQICNIYTPNKNTIDTESWSLESLAE